MVGMATVTVDEPTVDEPAVDTVAVDEALEAVRSAPAEELLADVVVGVSEQSAHLALWLAKVAEVDRRELWGHVEGALSCAHWLAWRCGIDPRTAREHVRVARRLDELVAVRRALARGQLSYSKVRALCRVATPQSEEFLLDLALTLSASHLERSLVNYQRSLAPPITLEDEIARRRHCGVTRWVDEVGLVHYEVVAPPEDALVLDKAIDFGCHEIYAQAKAKAAQQAEEAKQAGPDQDTPAAEPERPRRPSGRAGRLEGLVWAVGNGLSNLARGVVVEDPYLVVMHVTEGEAFVADDGRVDLGNGLALHPRVLQQLCCGSMIQAMLGGADGRPLDLGRRRRSASRDQRMALRAVHDRCAFPGGCGVPSEYCQFHHLAHWSRDQGGTDLDNLIPLCRTHHRLVHLEGWQLFAGADNKVALRAPDGRCHGEASPLAAMSTGPDALPRRLAEQGIHPDGTELGGRYAGERLSAFGLDVIVSGLWDVLGPDADEAATARGSPPSPN